MPRRVVSTSGSSGTGRTWSTQRDFQSIRRVDLQPLPLGRHLSGTNDCGWRRDPPAREPVTKLIRAFHFPPLPQIRWADPDCCQRRGSFASSQNPQSLPEKKKPRQLPGGAFSSWPGPGDLERPEDRYLIFVSLYSTCLRTTGSYFFTFILSGCRRLFLVAT